MNSNTTNKSSKELQSEVRSEINQIKQSLDNIKNRISPGQLIDDAIFYPHRGDPAMTFEHLKRNPIGTSFLAIGTLLLMEDDNHVSYESTVTRKVGDAAATSRQQVGIAVAEMKDSIHHTADSARSKIDELKGNAKAKVIATKAKVGAAKAKLKGSKEDDTSSMMDPTISPSTQEHLLSSQDRMMGSDDTLSSYNTANDGSLNSLSDDSDSISSGSYSSDSQSDSNFTGEVKEKITSTFDSASDSASRVAGQVKDTLSNSLNEASRKTENLTEQVKNKVSNTLHSASDSAGDLSGRVKDSVGTSVGAAREKVRNLDPMAYIAIGAGLGALSGATLPVSEAEHRLIDDKLGGKLDAFKADLQSALHESYDLMKSDFVSGITNFDLGKLKDTFSGHSSSRSV